MNISLLNIHSLKIIIEFFIKKIYIKLYDFTLKKEIVKPKIIKKVIITKKNWKQFKEYSVKFSRYINDI